MSDIAKRLSDIRAQLEAAARDAGRDPDAICLIAVSKTRPIDDVREAFAAGQQDFGENYLQDALPKIAACPQATWHFIGPLQGNKTRQVAEHFDWVHSVDRARIAQRLSDARPVNLPPLNICVQVNVSAEASKSGCTADELPALIDAIRALPRLQLRGLMAIPAPDAGPQVFESMRLLAESNELETLSMGMSGDFQTAIAAGATHVRIGTAIFGSRLPRAT